MSVFVGTRYKYNNKDVALIYPRTYPCGTGLYTPNNQRTERSSIKMLNPDIASCPKVLSLYIIFDYWFFQAS